MPPKKSNSNLLQNKLPRCPCTGWSHSDYAGTLDEGIIILYGNIFCRATIALGVLLEFGDTLTPESRLCFPGTEIEAWTIENGMFEVHSKNCIGTIPANASRTTNTASTAKKGAGIGTYCAECDTTLTSGVPDLKKRRKSHTKVCILYFTCFNASINIYILLFFKINIV